MSAATRVGAKPASSRIPSGNAATERATTRTTATVADALRRAARAGFANPGLSTAVGSAVMGSGHYHDQGEAGRPCEEHRCCRGEAGTELRRALRSGLAVRAQSRKRPLDVVVLAQRRVESDGVALTLDRAFDQRQHLHEIA